jgi:hypothetical protein
VRAALLALLLAAWALPVRAAAPVDSRAAELARLRREVETLSTELAGRKEALRADLRALEAQKLDLEVSLRREELRLGQVEAEAAARRDEIASFAGRGADLGPALREAVAAVRASVDAGLPYHQDERRAELDELLRQLDAGVLGPEAGVARLWAFTEDELRLTTENGLDRQIVPLRGQEVLAEVARLGMVALYFRTDGGELGAAVRTDGGWTWRVVEGREAQAAVEALFSTFRHGVRNGTFTLPNPHAGGTP